METVADFIFLETVETMETVADYFSDFLFSFFKLQVVSAAMKSKDAYSLEGKL